MNNKRLSLLCDMLVYHVIYGRTAKAVKIAQYLRDKYGFYIDVTLDCRTGYRKAVR